MRFYCSPALAFVIPQELDLGFDLIKFDQARKKTESAMAFGGALGEVLDDDLSMLPSKKK